ncbi:hypothetical protein ARMGADRAFT_1087724 [Armillaria gallica]|uniref:Uncharacterized protein n=1 Tax=Armillaria gallica TaxID=47427 RepID=A0A2H3CTU8_ARMGA|nr:hypothetical protein ARMGADRAFT_1087724 [Armillaria gallica]
MNYSLYECLSGGFTRVVFQLDRRTRSGSRTINKSYVICEDVRYTKGTLIVVIIKRDNGGTVTLP